MTLQVVELGEYGFKVVVNVKDSNGAARDLSGATSLQIKLQAANSPIIKTFTGSAEDLPNGAISYTVEEGDIDALGVWSGQALWSLSGTPGFSQWVEVLEVESAETPEMVFAQWFGSVAELVADKQAPGVDEARMFQGIKEASDWVQKNIGWFIPVCLTRHFHSDNGSDTLFLPASLLGVITITNDGVTLSAADYMLKPNDGFWGHGPYGTLMRNPASTLFSGWSSAQDGVILTGWWGMYMRAEGLDATVEESTLQNGTQTTLTVSNGGVVSPGMILLLGSEQEAVTGWGAPTEDVTALNMNGGLDASSEVATVDDASLVNVGEIIRLEFEQCKVLDRRTGTNQLSLARGWNGTGRTAHDDDTPVDVYRTLHVMRGVNGTIATAHANGTQLARYMVPDDILLLTKEIATLSVNKALGGYQGRTGNQETGVVFYNDIFPKFDIDMIKRNYYIPRAG